jgi:hypothetical protein
VRRLVPDPGGASPLAESWLRQAWDLLLAVGGALLAVIAALKRANIIEAVKTLFGGDREKKAPSSPSPSGGGDPYSLSKLSRLEAMEEFEREQRAAEQLLARIQTIADANRREYVEGLASLLTAIQRQNKSMDRLAARFEAASSARETEVATLRELVTESREILSRLEGAVDVLMDQLGKVE